MRNNKPADHKILYQLINAERNRHLLEKIPYVRYLDLAMIFYYPSGGCGELENARLVSNQDLDEWQITLEQLEFIAKSNTPTQMPFAFHTITDVLKELMEEDESLMLLEEPEAIIPMFVLTNHKKLFGAACMLYPNVLKNISLILQDDFYILPSSIHECILVPQSGTYSKEELTQIVKEINETQVPAQEVLSDQVYEYRAAVNRIYMD